MSRRNSTTERIALVALALVAIQPIIGMQAAVWCIAALTAFAVASIRRSTVRIDRRTLLLVTVLSLPFLLLVLDIPRASNLLAGWRTAERVASLAVIPVILIAFIPHYVVLHRNTVLNVFSAAAVILALYANSALIFESGGIEAFTSSEEYRERFSVVTGIHPVYASYYFLVAAMFQVHALRDGHGRIVRPAAIIMLVLAAALLASRMPLIAFFGSIGILFFTNRRSATASLFKFAVIGLVAIILLLALIPSLRQRTIDPAHAVEVRSAILYCAVSALEDNAIFGVGMANVQDVMDACYTQNKAPVSVDGSHGPHDQVLAWWLGLGVAGLAAFVLLFGISIREAWLRKNTLHLAFLVFLLLCSFTEDLLSRQWGIVLFAFFNSLFLATEKHTGPPAAPQNGL